MSQPFPPLFAPFPFDPESGSATFNSSTLDASGKKLAWVVQHRREGATITHVWLRYGTRTGTPPAYKIGLQGLDGSGQPDGTYLGGGSPASATFTPPADTTWNSTGQWIALDNSYAVTRGQYFAIVIEYSSGTVSSSHCSSFTQYVSGWGATLNNFPYSISHNGTSWSKLVQRHVFGWKSSTDVYGLPVVSGTFAQATSSNSRQALKFTVPASRGSVFSVAGARLCMDNPGSADWKLGLWNAAGTALMEITTDSDFSRSAGGSNRIFEMAFDDAPVNITPGGVYYLGLGRTTQDLYLRVATVSASNDLKAFDGGTSCHLSTWNGSSWTDDQTIRPLVELIPAGHQSLNQAGLSLGL